MAWIATVPPEEAKGTLKRIYAEAMARAGRVFNIVRLQSPRPKVLRASIQLYLQIMHGEESALSRAEREMIAVAVSRANNCFY
jgi:uncharacterized peroxidase-related enzyme